MAEVTAEMIGAVADEFVRARRARREIAAETARTYTESLRLFVRFVGATTPAADITREDVERWVEAQEYLASSTVRTRLCAVKAMFDWALDHELVTTDPTRRVTGPRLGETVPRALTSSQVAATLAACRTDRERLVVLLMCQEGLRRGGVTRLRLSDIDPVRRSMVVREKGSRERTVPISDETWTVLQRVHADSRWDSRSRVPVIGHQHFPAEPVTPRHVGDMARRPMERAGIDATGHALRHTCASDMLDAGATVQEVQAMLGHASIATTERYLRRVSVDRLRRAMGGRRYGDGPEAA